eukprot:scaffold39505_cov37-Cyclotella_meneghiniana.AAC.1
MGRLCWLVATFGAPDEETDVLFLWGGCMSMSCINELDSILAGESNQRKNIQLRDDMTDNAMADPT